MYFPKDKYQVHHKQKIIYIENWAILYAVELLKKMRALYKITYDVMNVF